MKTTTVLIEVYEHEENGAVSRLTDRFILHYNTDKYPTSEDFGKHLISLARGVARTKGLNFKVELEIKEDTLTTLNLKKKGLDIKTTFVINSYKI